VTAGHVVPGRHHNTHRPARFGVQLVAYAAGCGPGGYPIPLPWPNPLPIPGTGPLPVPVAA
jgi:hypothetical protein